MLAANFKFRLSGVTSTIIQLVPVQRRMDYNVFGFGVGLPKHFPKISFRDFLLICLRLKREDAIVFHARRNVEMLFAILARAIFLRRMKIVFTSASQRHHSKWTKWLILKMDSVISTSQKTASYLDIPSTVILHGIDGDRFHPSSEKENLKRSFGLPLDHKIIGCVGRIRFRKGTYLFVDSMIQLLPERPNWTAIIVGRATAEHLAFQRDLVRKIEEAGLSERIIFVGEHTNIPEWYQIMDLQVNPQRWEGFGLTPLEGMATEVPVVATDVGAFAEQLNSDVGEVGLLVPPEDLHQLSTAIAVYMDDGERRETAGRNGRTHVLAQFRIENEAQKIGDVYNSLFT